MSLADKLWRERPRKEPAEYAVRLARKRSWQNIERCFIAIDPDVEELVGLLPADAEIAHPLIFVLSRLPQSERRAFADAFFGRRRGDHRWSRHAGTARAAAAALHVLPLTGRPDLESPRIEDLLRGIAQGDDLSLTPPQAAIEVYEVVARTRLEVDHGDALDPQAAVTIAVLEVLAPSSETIAVHEVLTRATWAVLQLHGGDAALELLIAVDAIAGDD